MTIIDELWCIYHVLLRQNKYVTSFFSCSNSSIRSNTQSWNCESWFFFTKLNGFIFKYLKIGFFGKNKSACQFWKSVLSKSKQTKEFRICRFRIGCCIWWNSYKKWSCHPRPTEPREVPQSIKKTEKNGKKEPYLHIFLQIHIFSQIHHVFISKI